MASSTKAARFLVVALFVVTAVILPSSVCHGIRSAEDRVVLVNPTGLVLVAATPPTPQHPLEKRTYILEAIPNPMTRMTDEDGIAVAPPWRHCPA
nr:unnamed protein product [Digitaria exilis]